MKYSIIIPTYNKFEETIKPCIESLVKYTTINDNSAEIIVVANGCTDGTEAWIKKMAGLFPTITLVSSKKALGYTKAVNKGLKVAKGEYIVLLNNDTVLLNQGYNDWLNILVKPFLDDPTVGITGPMRTFCEHAGRNFLIFFCVMISRRLYEDLGPLDEAFSPGYGEDTDYCCKAEDLGYKVLQVPVESSIYYDKNRMTGNFPIYHAGNVTFKNWPGGEELLKKNNGILRERYNILVEEEDNDSNISKALKCDGYMSEKELTWLADNSKDKDVIIEIGSWHGRSSRALGDNAKGVVYCIDTWNGSAAEQTTGHVSAKFRDGDHAFYEFLQNNLDLIQTGKIVPLRMTSNNAAALFKEKSIQANMIFIDAGHTYEEVVKDISIWKPLVKKGGILCGHDYYHHGEAWPGVQQAVDEEFGHKGTDMGYIENNSIWRHIITDEHKESRPPCIFDCFIFNNEFEILEKRFETLYDTVDRFIIVEATRTHGNKPKELNFNNNLGRFEKWLNKVTYLVVEDFPAEDSWSIERHQRDAIMRGLTSCQDDDIIIISDCDEIPSISAIERFDSEIRSFEMDLYYYDEHTRAKDKWLEAKILTYEELKKLTPCGARYTKAKVLKKGGRHLSYFGGVDTILKKLEDTAHQEYNTPVYKNKTRIKKAIKEGVDLFGRDLKFEHV